MVDAQYRIVGTAGHIDHGKSALVRALTGTDPDRLQEERERGITIDLGFAHLDVSGGTRVGFVDVPGHERFVKNMLAGIGGIDAVLLVVAADESVMPQTREHLAICELLGVDSGVVALTKCDIVDDEIADLVELEVRELLAGTLLENAPVVHTSARTGVGLDELQETLVRVLDNTAGRADQHIARLPVDRVFTVRGFGTVVTGTLLSGAIRTGDKLELLPEHTPVNVRGVQVYGDRVELATAGQRTAVNLQGIDVGAVARGDLLVSPSCLATTYMIDARLQMLPGHALKQQQRVRFHHGAAEILCRVAVLDREHVEPGDTALVQLRLEAPYACAPGDRFVVRRYSPMLTVGGGVVIDNLPRKHRHGEKTALSLLEKLDGGTAERRLIALVTAAGTTGIDEQHVRHRMFRTAPEIRGLLSASSVAQRIVVARADPLLLVDGAVLEPLKKKALEAIGNHHRDHPLSPGLPKSALAGILPGRVPEPVLDTIIKSLTDTGEIRPDTTALALIDHEVALSEEQRRVRDGLLELYDAAGLSTPSITDAWTQLGVAAAEGEPVFHLLLREGALVRLRDDLVFRSSRLEALIAELQNRYSSGDSFSVADFKELAGISRKHAIPLLEYLDQERFTRREGDKRVRV